MLRQPEVDRSTGYRGHQGGAVERETTEAKLKLIGEMAFVGTATKSGCAIVIDAEPQHGGQGAGPRPMELLLLALGGCTGMDVISILRKKRQDVTSLEVRVKGTRAAEQPRRYEEIEVEFVVWGRNISEAAVARSIELSHDKYCGVTATLNAPVRTSYRIENED